MLGSMKCVVCIGSDYPQTPPAFVIKIEDMGEKDAQEVQIKVNKF